MQIIELNINELKPYKNNAKTHTDEQIDQIVKSIEEFGMNDPVGIWGEENLIVEGHGRLLALKKMGKDTVPCIRLDHLTEEQRKAYTLAHNKLTMNTDFDFEMLEKELQDIEMDMSDFGFDFDIVEPEVVEDEVPEVDEESEPTAKLGDIWQLGRHKLMCGNSTDKETVEKLMNGVKADMVFTDPPYGIFATGGRSQTKEKLKMKNIENDNLQNEKLIEFLHKSFNCLKVKQEASIYICYPWATQEEFTQAIKMSNLKIKQCIIWDKKVFGLNGHKGYRPQYEMIYFCCKEDFQWYGNKGQSNIWKVSREIKRDEQGNHPTPKPIELISIALKNSSKAEDYVIDLFGGSGSTLIACEQLNRICYMMELDPKYVDVIIKRWETLTGETAVLIN